VTGGVTGGVIGSELAEICQQSHMSVTEHLPIHSYGSRVLDL